MTDESRQFRTTCWYGRVSGRQCEEDPCRRCFQPNAADRKGGCSISLRGAERLTPSKLTHSDRQRWSASLTVFSPSASFRTSSVAHAKVPVGDITSMRWLVWKLGRLQLAALRAQQRHRRESFSSRRRKRACRPRNLDYVGPESTRGRDGEARQRCSVFETPKPESLMQRVLAHRHGARRPCPRLLPRQRHHRRRRSQDGPALDRHRDGRARSHALPAAAAECRGRRTRRHQQSCQLARRRWLPLVQLGPPLFDENGEIHSEVRFADLAAFIWMRETGTALPRRHGGTPLLGEFDGCGYYLLFNGILGDRRPPAATC